MVMFLYKVSFHHTSGIFFSKVIGLTVVKYLLYYIFI